MALSDNIPDGMDSNNRQDKNLANPQELSVPQNSFLFARCARRVWPGLVNSLIKANEALARK
jgi:hypothetical protein